MSGQAFTRTVFTLVLTALCLLPTAGASFAEPSPSPTVSFTGADSGVLGGFIAGVTILGASSDRVVRIDYGDGSEREVYLSACSPAKAARTPVRCSVVSTHEYLSPGVFLQQVRVAGRVSSRTVTVRPVPAPWSPPAGWVQPEGWSMLTSAATFLPCQQVSWFVDPAGQPADRAGIGVDVSAALSVVAEATGLVFGPVGSASDADVVVSWSGSLSHPAVGGGQSGRGAITLSSTYFWTSDEWAGSGVVSKQWTDAQGSWSYTVPGRVWLLVHEFGHVVGLGHVSSTDELMSSSWSNRSSLGAGDLNGLWTMYKSQPCPSL